MPVHWTVFHATRQVVISAKGIVRLSDMEECVEGIMTPATLSYRKLVDLSDALAALSRDDIVALAEYARERSGNGLMGPLAITVGSDDAEQQARLFGTLAAADRPWKIFRELEAAHTWLDAQPAPVLLPWLEEPPLTEQSDVPHPH